MKVLVVFLMMIVSCKAKVKESETSDPDFAISKDGTMLVTALGKNKRGFCILQTATTNIDDKRLLTVDGALNKTQLKKTLRHLGYPEQVFSVLGSGLLGSAVGTGAVLVGGVALAPALAVGLVTLVGGTIGYRIIRGNIEGEKAAPITLDTIFTVGLFGIPLVESQRREDRFVLVVSDRKQLAVTDRKMRKFIERIRDTKGKYVGECDHLKS